MKILKFRKCGALFVCLTTGVFIFLTANLSGAAKYCVGTDAELDFALTDAQSNGEDDIIRIMQGTYYGNFTYDADEFETYNLIIKGGYKPNPPHCKKRVVDPATTVLDAQNRGRVLTLECSNAADLVIDGITIQYGEVTGVLGWGGGLYVSTNRGNVTLNNNTIRNNLHRGFYAINNGGGEVTLNNNNISNNPRGGVYLLEIDKVTLNKNTISDNISPDMENGGGIYLEDINTVTLNENIINNNGGATNTYGGGIFGHLAGNVSLTNNTITYNSAFKGGGVYFTSSEIVTFTNNNISNNICGSSGGGVYVRDAAEVNLVNNIINNNSSTTAGGGGAHIQLLGTAILTNNLISNNSAQSGGGASLSAGTAILTNNTIINNRTDQSGCGVVLGADTAILTNNTISNNIANNEAESDGGGVILVLRSVSGIANIYNNIIWNNQAESIGEDLYINNNPDQNPSPNGTVNLYNNDFDLSTGFYIKVDDSSVVYFDNLNNEDPLFVDPANDDYHLTAESPCINAGTKEAPELPKFDFEGDPRRKGRFPDIGADEYKKKKHTH